ncbi:MAG: hypothetical protein EBR82_68915, partial [Caulobacteraceae bacterium]|nr:hypothetical protein [Caulobacteraceae bacterium]
PPVEPVILAVPIVAVVVTESPLRVEMVPIVAVFTLMVPIVAVPVEAVMFDPNVAAPSTANVRWNQRYLTQRF